MKRAGKIFAFLMVISILFANTTGLVQAQTHNNENVIVENNMSGFSVVGTGTISGERTLSKQEYNDYLQNLTLEELQIIAEKTAAANETAYQWEVKRGTFSVYRQTESYYCVPATARTIVQYINGSSDTQAVIAEALGTTTTGTDPTELSAYLRSKQSVCYYIYSAYSSQSSMMNNIYHDVVSMSVPASIGIAGATTSNWHYATSGHSLVVYGIQDDKSGIRIADPIGGYNGNAHPSFYNKTAEQASNVCTRIVW